VPKGSSEGLFRETLNKIDFDPTFIYKPPDDARNWKPTDYFLWFPAGSAMPVAGTAWFEVKETPNLSAFPLTEVRPSQWRGIGIAAELKIPYFFAIRWKRDGMWSLVDAVRLAAWLEAQDTRPKSVTRVALESRFGVSSTVGQLPSMIRAALMEGL
jgi:hypothetical protein